MMVKEHFIDLYGPVAYTIGWGASGGAIQQYDVADAYPGILDGIIPVLHRPAGHPGPSRRLPPPGHLLRRSRQFLDRRCAPGRRGLRELRHLHLLG
jgi:hypothetical protein